MTSKSKVNALNGAHTAGIYADMTVDGPEIGTLVVIVDRAKNLPNRKTIGKQDPYCAARLGKEAKKTETDRRGGQTPRWDQELRFTVHDSPDYYQLKVSVFNDDKKTDLIGETWINLQEVIIPGGGQNDLWHSLNCKGKYAGEVRIEITYYDMRPKQEKPEKARQAGANGVEDGKDSLKGPRQQQKPPMKRRPLPSDPVTGAPPPQVDGSPPRAYQQPPTAIPEHVRTPQRGPPSPGYISNQSPLQTVEYHTPSARFSQSHSYGGSPSANSYESSPDIFAASPTARELPKHGRYDIHDPMPMDPNHFPKRSDYCGDQNRYSEPRNQYEDRYDDRHRPYELPQPQDFGSPPSPDGPPPPPPAHRSRNNSQHISPVPPLTSQRSYGFPADSRPPNPYDTEHQDMHRRSMPAFTNANSYRPYTPVKEEQFRQSTNGTAHGQATPRHNSYDSRYNGNYSSMQPSVEDAPPTPTSHGSRASHSDDRRYDQVPSPAPLNLSGRGSAASGRYSASTALSTQYSHGNGSAKSPVSFRDQQSSVSSQTSCNSLPPQKFPSHYSDDSTGSGDRMGEYGTPDGYGLPPVPPTLVAGMDPSIAQEISDRIYAEKRSSYNQSNGNSPRTGRYDSPQYQPNRPHPLKYQEIAAPFVPAAAIYDERRSRIATATVPIVKPRAISPDTRSPTRKSVSPSPAPESPEKRRLSGVPFGPDSYNALNPVSDTAPVQLSAKYDPKVDPNAMIITHDGREIDPSDHIPESNYAPLLEPKGPKYASQQPDRNYRPPPAEQATTRRQHPVPSPIVFHNGNPYSEPPTPHNGRNRLQKKTNRMSAQAAPQSSPLAPITSYQSNNYSPSPRSLPRPHTGDYSNENYAPQHHGSSPGYRGGVGEPPPIPAKIPNNPHASPPQANNADAWALLEEMKNIDLGTGRARRRI